MVPSKLEINRDSFWDRSTKSLRKVMLEYAEILNDDLKEDWINLLKQGFGENFDREFLIQPLAVENQKTFEPQRDLSDEDRLPKENSMLPLGNFVEHLVGENSYESQINDPSLGVEKWVCTSPQEAPMFETSTMKPHLRTRRLAARRRSFKAIRKRKQWERDRGYLINDKYVLEIGPTDEDAMRCKLVALIKDEIIDDALSVINSSQKLPIDLRLNLSDRPRDMPPTFPSRPNSRARLPSARRSLPAKFNVCNVREDQTRSVVTSAGENESQRKEEGKRKEKDLGVKRNSLGSKKMRTGLRSESPYAAEKEEEGVKISTAPVENMKEHKPEWNNKSIRIGNLWWVS